MICGFRDHGCHLLLSSFSPPYATRGQLVPPMSGLPRSEERTGGSPRHAGVFEVFLRKHQPHALAVVIWGVRVE